MSIDKRLADLERQTAKATRFFLVKTTEDSDGVEYDGQTFEDLDSWKRAVGFRDSDHVTVVEYVTDWR